MRQITFQGHTLEALGRSRCSALLAQITPYRIDGGAARVEVSDDLAFRLAECLERETEVNREAVNAAVARGDHNRALEAQNASIIQAWKDVQAAIGLATREG